MTAAELPPTAAEFLLRRFPDDPTVRLLLADEHDVGPGTGGSYVLAPGAVRDIAGRLAAVATELTDFGVHDVRDYARVIHALARDLLSVTGACGTVWTHPAHLAFVEEVNARWSHQPDPGDWGSV